MFKRTLLSTVVGCGLAMNSFAMNIQPDPQNPTGFIVAQSEIDAAEAAQTTNPMYDIWAKALATAPNTVVEAIEPGLASNPANVKRLERVFPRAEWDFLTQMAAPEYTYTRLLRAVGKFPAFCGEYTDGRNSDEICKESIITAFAHFSQETGGHIAIDNVSDNPLRLEEWQQALVHVREMGWAEGQEGYTTGCGQNDWQNRRWPCAAGQGYFGRGAKQLSYHFNYGAFSEVMFDGDATVLLNNPALVADSWLNLASAIWFFLTPQAPKPAMLHVIDRTWKPSQRELDAGIGYGFGTTINIINGGIECGEQNRTKGQPVNRIRYWEGLSSHYQIKIEADEANTCWQQTPFGSMNLTGATDVLFTNWDGDWSYNKDHPSGGNSFACKLVSYQTAYSALVPGDYAKCVTNFFGSHANWPEVRVVPDAEMPADTGTGTGTGTTEPDQGGVAGWDANKVYSAGGTQVSYKGAIYENKWYADATNVPGAGDPWKFIKDVETTTVTPSTFTCPNGTVVATEADCPVVVVPEFTCPNGTVVATEADCPVIVEPPKFTCPNGTVVATEADCPVIVVPEFTCPNGTVVATEADCPVIVEPPKFTCPDGTVVATEADCPVIVVPEFTCPDGTVVATEADCPAVVEPTNAIVWVAGKTKVANGDTVTNAGKCFVAKNNPGVWESPTATSWFWDEVACK